MSQSCKIIAFFIVCLIFGIKNVRADSIPPSDSINNKFNNRKIIVPVIELSVLSASSVLLWQAWYKGYNHSSFHWFNDNSEWLQMDKASHCNTSYWLTRSNYSLLRWAGYSNTKARWMSVGGAFTAMASIEFFDGMSSEWGASWGDLLANSTGIGIYTIQNLTHTEDLFQLKFSYWPSQYRTMRPKVLGSNEAEGIIKDYNGQTHWLSVSLNNAGCNFMPRWLNIAIGYGADGMTGGKENYPATIENSLRKRSLYISPDFNWLSLHPKKTWAKILVNTLMIIKIPAPTVEFNSSGACWYWIKF